VDIKIRELTRKDTITVANLIKKMVEKAGKTHLLNLIAAPDKGKADKGKNNDDLLISVGLDIVMSLFDFVLEDVSAWFADLAGLSLEEYNEKAPFDADLQIIEQLREAQGVKDFFTRALRVYKMINVSAKQLSEKKS
jgi:predicted DNA-binding ribbon-helix-helix protein